MFNFAPDQNQGASAELIPSGTLLLTTVTVIKVSHSKNSGGKMAQFEFTVARGPYERRKIWKYVGDPADERNSEKWRPMCLADLQHMLESCGIFNPADPSTYARFANASFEQVLGALEGKPVAIIASIEKGTDGNDDRNGVKQILSPNPNGRTHKKYDQIRNNEDLNPPASPAAATASFGGFAAPQGVQNVAPQPMGAGATAQAAAPAAPSNAPAWLQG